MIIRGLALGEIKTRDAFKIIRKEFAISLLVGSVLAVVNLGKLLLLDRVSLMAVSYTHLSPPLRRRFAPSAAPCQCRWALSARPH